MIIQLKKGKDAGPTLTCIRMDGSRTWGKLHPFFPAHDLTHCSVESVLGFEQAFFVLVASGWNIDDFAAKGAARKLPAEAGWAESIVGILDQERGLDRIYPAAEFNEALRESLRGQGAEPFRDLTEAELAAIRKLRGRLIAEWQSLPVGDTLQVSFPVSSQDPLQSRHS